MKPLIEYLGALVNKPLVAIALVLGWPLAFYMGVRFEMLYLIFGSYAFVVSALALYAVNMSLSGERGPSILNWFGGLAFGLCGVLVAHLVFSLFRETLPFLAREVDLLFAALAPNSVYDIAAMGIVIAAEELLFRGLLQSTLERAFASFSGKGLFFASILQILIYALAQMATVSISVFLAGVALGIGVTLLAKWSGSLWPSILGHALWTYGVVVVFPLT